MEDIPIVRAGHLLVCLDTLREIGAPVERELGRSKLPSLIEDNPDDFISVRFALDFIARCAGDAPVAELAFLATRRAGLGILHRDFRLSLLRAVSGLAKFNALVHHAQRECTALVAGLARQSANLRVICDLEPFRDHPAVAYSEWLIQHVMLSIGRSFAGPNWFPAEMTFMSRELPCEAALESFGACRLLPGRSHTSMLFPIERLLACPAGGAVGSGDEYFLARSVVPSGTGFIATLRLAIRPYLADGLPDIGLAAEIAGLSRRTFQRELARHGATYSELVREARFDAACRLLGDPDLKIIEIAFETGYANPQHFSRAFRQFSGMSPRAYRKHCAAASGDGFGVA